MPRDQDWMVERIREISAGFGRNSLDFPHGVDAVQKRQGKVQNRHFRMDRLREFKRLLRIGGLTNHLETLRAPRGHSNPRAQVDGRQRSQH